MIGGCRDRMVRYGTVAGTVAGTVPYRIILFYHSHVFFIRRRALSASCAYKLGIRYSVYIICRESTKNSSTKKYLHKKLI